VGILGGWGLFGRRVGDTKERREDIQAGVKNIWLWTRVMSE